MLKSRSLRWVGFVACMEEMRNAYNILILKPEGKRPLGRLRRRWDDTIRMYHRVIGWECVDWMHLTQNKDQWLTAVNAVMNPWIP